MKIVIYYEKNFWDYFSIHSNCTVSQENMKQKKTTVHENMTEKKII